MKDGFEVNKLFSKAKTASHKVVKTVTDTAANIVVTTKDTVVTDRGIFIRTNAGMPNDKKRPSATRLLSCTRRNFYV